MDTYSEEDNKRLERLRQIRNEYLALLYIVKRSQGKNVLELSEMISRLDQLKNERYILLEAMEK